MNKKSSLGSAVSVAIFVSGLLCGPRQIVGVAAGADAPPDGVQKLGFSKMPYFIGMPGDTAYVTIDGLPVFSKDGITDVRLPIGKAVTMIDSPRSEKGYNTIDIEWTDGGAKQTGIVTRYGLSVKKPVDPKPLPTPEPPSEADAADPKKEQQRMSGTWIVVGVRLLGKMNPLHDDQIPFKDAPSIGPAIPGAPPQLPAGATGDTEIPVVFFMPASTHYRFEGAKVTKWGILPAIEEKNKGATVWTPNLHIEETVELDTTTNPKRIDAADTLFPKRLQRATPGIYAWEKGEVLVWGMEASFGGGLTPKPRNLAMPGMPAPPADAGRPASFKPDDLKKAAVVYLKRVDPKLHPAPKPKPNRNKEAGGNFF